MNKKITDSGFTLIELMIVVAIIGILAAIAIPNFLGMQEKSKRRAVEDGAAVVKAELHNWMDAAIKGESGVVDVDGDGFVGPNELHTTMLTVVNSWLQAFINKKGTTPLSPWNGTKELFTVGPPNPANTGMITLSVLNSGRSVKIIALDIQGSTLLTDTVSIE